MLDEAKKVRVCDLLRAGVSIGGAMRVVGLTRDVYYQWLRKGREFPDSIHGEFVKESREARGEIEREMVGLRVEKARRYDNDSIDRILKCVNREDYADRLQVNDELRIMVERLQKNLSEEDFRKFMAAMED